MSLSSASITPRRPLQRLRHTALAPQPQAVPQAVCAPHRWQEPWDAYDSVDVGERHQVKRITVRPGAKLSLQMHHHRAEHWIVIKGTALVTRGEEDVLLTENQSTCIPLGVKHRLENPGKTDPELIEVQSGSYLGEDDIVRFEDTYGRAPVIGSVPNPVIASASRQSIS